MNKIKYEKIDTAKIYCSVLIVLMHCLEIPQQARVARMLVQCLAQQSVPFFFITSGFFFSKKLQRVNGSRLRLKATLKYSRHLLFLYIGWIILWLPKVFLTYTELYGLSLRTFFVMIRRLFFAGEGVYWYVLVLSESALCVGFLYAMNKRKQLLCFASVGMLLGICYEFGVNITPICYLNSIFYLVFSWSNNLIMKGIPFFTIGVLYAERKQLEKTVFFIAVYLLVTCVNLYIFFTCNKYYGIYSAASIMYPFQALMLFLWGVNGSKDKIKLSRISNSLRERSSVYYFLHTVFIYGFIDPIIGMEANITIRFGITLVMCELSYYLIKRINDKNVNWLVNIKD